LPASAVCVGGAMRRISFSSHDLRQSPPSLRQSTSAGAPRDREVTMRDDAITFARASHLSAYSAAQRASDRATRERTHDAAETMAEIVAKRLVEHLERSGFVVMKKPPIGDGAAIGRGHDGR
jgi:hypothetical protein